MKAGKKSMKGSDESEGEGKRSNRESDTSMDLNEGSDQRRGESPSQNLMLVQARQEKVK